MGSNPKDWACRRWAVGIVMPEVLPTNDANRVSGSSLDSRAGVSQDLAEGFGFRRLMSLDLAALDGLRLAGESREVAPLDDGGTEAVGEGKTFAVVSLVRALAGF